MKNLIKTRTVWTVEWKNVDQKWYNQKFFLYQEAAGFAESEEVKNAPIVIIRESRENNN